jgi:ABC-type antimicrobial peptide transport system ATPase subunit
MYLEDKSLQSDCQILEQDLVLPREMDASQRLETFFYLIPVVGLIPSLWAIYRRQRDKKQLAVCRLSVLLAFIWLTIYLSCNVGADLSVTSTSIALRLLFINGLATSGYFVSSLWLMVLMWQNKSVRLAGFSYLAENTLLPNSDNLNDR